MYFVQSTFGSWRDGGWNGGERVTYTLFPKQYQLLTFTEHIICLAYAKNFP